MAKAYAATAPGHATAAPAPAPTTRRITRSQSAEPQDAPATRASARRSASAQAPGVVAKTSGRRDMTKAIAEELPTVQENTLEEEEEEEEEEDGENQDGVQATPAEQLDGAAVQPSARRASVASGFSGTTAKTSFSQDEINKLDHEVICDVLPGMASAAERLIQLLLPRGASTAPQTWKEIKHTGSKHNKLYTSRWESLRIHKPSLTSIEYIEPSYVLRALLNAHSMADIQPATWRPDNVLYRINMALMLRTILILCDPDPENWTEDATGALESLDMAFPACIAGGEFQRAALDLWLELAAHVTIRRLDEALEADPNFSPHEEIENVFWDAGQEFKHGKALGLTSLNQDNYDQAIARVNARMRILQDPFDPHDGAGATAAIGSLKAQFQWDDFRSHALSYLESRLAEVNRGIEAAGGVQAIVTGLANEVERRASEKLAEQMKQHYRKPVTPIRRSLGGKSAIALLKEREKRISDAAPVMAATAPADNFASMDETLQNNDVITHDFAATQQPEHIHEIYEAPEEMQSTAQRALPDFAAAQLQNARKAKLRLVDRQENAVRVSSEMFIESPSQPPRATGKRTRAEMEDEVPDAFDPTQDDGFENDTRDGAPAAQRRAEIAYARTEPQRFPIIDREISAAPGPSTLPSTTTPAQPSPAKRQRKNPGSAIPPPRPPLGPEDGEMPARDFYRTAKQDAKYNRVTAPSTQIRTTRSPWSDEEESALIDLIAQHVGEDESISWANLKAIDQALEASGEAHLMRRSAEDIRFKARNMKTTLLLAQRRLPRNWNKVILDKKSIDKLRARGIPYDQAPVRAPRRSVLFRSESLEAGDGTSGGVSHELRGVI